MATDLAIRETILGVIKSKDVNGRGVIHSSDFRSAVADLGFPFGHPIIENILVHCVINSEGFVDFTGLERELARERRVLNAKATAATTARGKTSTGTPLTPWRADVVHQQKMQSERQAKLLQEKHNDVLIGFQQYEEQEISQEQFIDYIKELGIVPTRSFLELLRQHRSCEITFGEFMRSLINYDPNSKSNEYSHPAGGAASLLGKNDSKNREELQAGLFYARKRMDYAKKTAMQSSTVDIMKTGRRMVGSDGAKNLSTKAKPTGNLGEFFKSSKNIQTVLHASSDPSIMFSHNQEQMIPDKNCHVHYSSEEKMLREQVLAALRKLDAGEFSTVEFQDKIFTMGIELPEIVLKELQRQEQSGAFHWNTCVKAIDNHVFKRKVLDEAVPVDTIQQLLHTLKDKIVKTDRNGLSKLLMLFYEADEDKNKALCFSEFQKCLQKLQIAMNTTDIRVLFNHFDADGNGSLSAMEFINALRGDVSSNAEQITRFAFNKYDRLGNGVVPVSEILPMLNWSAHPEVVRCGKQPDEVLGSMYDIIEAAAEYKNCGEPMLTQDLFQLLLLNLLPFYTSEEPFIDMIHSFCSIGDRKPPPPTYTQLIGGSVRAPLARQHHGDYITWAQEESMLEKAAAKPLRMKKPVEATSARSHPHVFQWNSKKNAVSEEELNNDWKIDGLAYIKRHEKNDGDPNLLVWDSPKRIPAAPSPPRPQQQSDSNDNGLFLMKNYKWSESKKHQYAGGCPYGVDEEPQHQQQAVKAKSAPKSLAEIVNVRT